MAVIFPSWTNKIPPAIGVGVPIIGVVAVLAISYWFSPNYTDVGYRPIQPTPFSHKIHANGLGLDCRFCHNTVERSFYSAVPPTETCMTCHLHVRKDRPTLGQVRIAWQTGKPIKWVRVHMLPDYAFFNHSVHVAAGVGCKTCHGRVDRMVVVEQKKSLSMAWCLECHRNPTPYLRPPSEVTNMTWVKPKNYKPKHTRKLEPPLHCSGCHR